MNNYITNCPNCGAPIKRYGYCEYCGTVINQPLQIISVRPGQRRLVCQMQMPVYIGEENPEIAAKYAKNEIRSQMVDALTESIKFISKREYDPRRFEEVITVRGEVWVVDPNMAY